MTTRNPNGVGSDDATTPRTIEDLERRAEEIEGAELEALHRIAELLRELAVELPHESKLPVSFAKTAKRIDRYVECTFHPSWAVRDLNAMVDDFGIEAVEKYAAQLEDFLGRR